MAIYEYRCAKCGTVNEFLVGVGVDSPEIQCSRCGSSELKKIFSKANFKINDSFSAPANGETCCGRAERCEYPQCESGSLCHRG